MLATERTIGRTRFITNYAQFANRCKRPLTAQSTCTTWEMHEKREYTKFKTNAIAIRNQHDFKIEFNKIAATVVH